MMASEGLLNQILSRLHVVTGPDSRGEHVAWCVFHADGQGKAPHSANLNVSERGWYCHVCNRGGSLRQLAQELGIAISTQSNRRIVATYDYCDETGTLLFQVVRKSSKGFYQRRPDGNGGWINNLNGTRSVLYRLPDLLAEPEKPVWIVEGEKDADRLADEGLLATTNSGGAGKWRPEYAAYLRGREVRIIPDNDELGRPHAGDVAQSLATAAESIKIIELVGVEDKGDVSDWLRAGHTVAELEALATQQAVLDPGEALNQGTESFPQTTSSGRARQPQADELVDLALAAGLERLRDEMNEPYLRIRVGGHWELWPASARAVRSWLTLLFHYRHARAPNLTALNTAANVLQAQARFDGTTTMLYNRTAPDGGDIYYDLSDSRWRAIKVTTDGWEVVSDPPALFRRYAHQQAQQLPEAGGRIEELFELIHVPDPQLRLLLLAYLVACLVPDIPHPICILHGPQGSSKTTTSRLLRQLIDPSAAPVGSLPADPERLVQSLAHNWMPVYDNLNGLPRWASDTLSRSATGEGFAKRALYTDDEDFIWSFRRCAVLNGINVAAAQPDLLDRAILIGLDRIGTKERRLESEIEREFAAARPRLLGAMFTILSQAMRERTNVFASDLPRMADFAQWGMAIAAALGHSPDEFLSAYDENISRQNTEVLNAHPLASVLVSFIDRAGGWAGSATELLGELGQAAEAQHVDTKGRHWPKQPNQLARKLNELSATLHAIGVAVLIERDRAGSRITLNRVRDGCDDDDGHRHTHRHAQPVAAQGEVTM